MTTELSKHPSITAQFDNALQSKASESSLLRRSNEPGLPKGVSSMLVYKHNQYGHSSIAFLFRVDEVIPPKEMEIKLEAAHGLVNPRRDLKHEVADVRIGSGIYYRDDKFAVGKTLVSLYTKYCPNENFIEVGIYGQPKEWNHLAAQKIRAVLADLEKAL